MKTKTFEMVLFGGDWVKEKYEIKKDCTASILEEPQDDPLTYHFDEYPSVASSIETCIHRRNRTHFQTPTRTRFRLHGSFFLRLFSHRVKFNFVVAYSTTRGDLNLLQFPFLAPKSQK
ncbi:unnamed protein product [Vicia faba]|uniref:Uncharacterized protein n=1 Tax=Vicia faba TaxID=3906 RepID=A0AAV0ZLE7_VICFA|nr:unnamed protein product [Vicia faba]